MGDRIVFTLKQHDGLSLNLYSHWGGNERFTDLAIALYKARPRWTDENYCSRIIISNLIGTMWDSETGFGLWAGNSEGGFYGGDHPDITIDLTRMTVNDETGEHSWVDFCNYHLPVDMHINTVV
jgi:hypothetical protein